jgi:hypothetical protein
MLISSLNKSYDEGSFGIPKKIKLPETNKHFDIIDAKYEDAWKASRGIGQTFLIDDERQKVFGQAIVYMRTNTPTTHGIGEVFAGDVINIVTTEGWQLGYEVAERTNDLSGLKLVDNAEDSEIIVVLVDDKSGERVSFRAVLSKVGERI